MATLQTSQQSSAFTARSRLKQVIPVPTAHADTAPEPTRTENFEEIVAASLPKPVEPILPGAKHRQLSELDQHHLLLKTVAVYNGWHLVSIQRRAEGNVLVAHLLRNGDNTDPTLAVRNGQTMQVIMDSMGDMKVQYARRRPTSWWGRFFSKLAGLFAPRITT
jgi:hypothetical protein